jgi:outer membrane PBP1 activator LpoA protein
MILTTALLAVLAACGVTPPAPVSVPRSAAAAEAAAAFERGAYEEAAIGWQREALGAAPAAAAALRVRAADAWLLAARPGDAEGLLRWVVRDELAPPDRARLDLVLADLALSNNRPDEAEAALARAADALPAASRERYRALLARLQEQLGRPGARNLAEAAQLVGAMERYDPAATLELLRVLESVTSRELSVRALNPRAERQLTGWLDLALVIRQNLVLGEQVADAIAAWKSRHPQHLLDESQGLDTWLRYRQTFPAPRRTAVLLPASGGLRLPADAIRDGLMSAYLAQPTGGELLFFATGDDDQSTISAYFNALDAGADRIVGPLRKESVAAMLNLAGLATPVLALNELPQPFTPPPGLSGQVTGLALSQEAESAAIARHAAAAGYRRAAVLAPEGAWGERMAASFQDEFLRDDRQIVAATRYPESENDHSSLLERVLEIDASTERGRQLENTLQIPLEFEPTRRNDVDVIFMAANATQAKLIRPQLRFLDAGDIPVYATGRIYSGEPEPALNQDLDGVRFPATPWALAHATRGDLPRVASLRGGSMGSLFALGQDAWNILPWLDLMRKDPDFGFPGQSGIYRMGPAGALQREPAWAVFSDGVPVALPPQVEVRVEARAEAPAGAE